MKEHESKIKWASFLQGDKKAYTWIYDQYVRELFRYGMRFTSNKEQVKDSIQEIFTSIYKNRQQLSVPDNVKVYLFVCLKNNLFRIMRRESMFEMMELQTMPFVLEPTVEEELIEKEHQILQKEKVEELLSMLTPRQQEIIYYRFVQEMSFEEIGQLMNLNYQSAQNLIQRSLKKLRNVYGGIPSVLIILFGFLR